MVFRRRKITDRIQTVVDEVLHLWQQESLNAIQNSRPCALQAARLEERILMSASPVAIVAEVAATALESGASLLDAGSSEMGSEAESIGESAQEVAPAVSNDFGSSAPDSVISEELPNDEYLGNADAAHGPELIVIDYRVQDADTLLASLLDGDRDVRLLRLASDEDGLTQITEKLERIGNVSTIHLLTHGRDGEILLGSTRLNADTLVQHAPELLAWQHSLTANADLLLYGCDVAETAVGEDFVESLSRLTGADVAASTDATGSQQFGGDWELEYQLGAIETQVFGSSLIASDWSDLLGVITVSTTDDVLDGDTSSVAALLASKGFDGLISLREAIIATNNTVGADSIFLSTGVYTLSLAGRGEDLSLIGDLDIQDGLTISGAGSGLSIIDANSLDRVFHVNTGDPVTIEDVTIRGGVTPASNWGGGILIDAGSTLNLNRVIVTGNSTGSGAGIYNYATLNATDTIISNNTGSNWGGGIYNDGGTIVLERVTISGNFAAKDGGGFNSAGSGASVSLTNVTISGNTATNNGGGIWTSRSVTATNSTIAFNTATAGDGVFGQGGLGVVTLKNSVLQNPTGVNANKALTSLGNNIDSDGSAGLTGPTDQSNIDPGLDATLQINGGFVTTHRLLSGSAAIDMGSAVAAPTLDARSSARDSTPDIGAYEVQGPLASRSESLVNTTTTNIQSTSSQSRGSTHAVAAARDGSHVVVWSSQNQDGSGWGVYGQRFDAAGAKVGGEFLINQTTTSDQKYATVAMNGRGDFVVSWTSFSQDGSDNGVYARQYNAAGTARGDEFRVNTTTTGAQDSPVVAMAADGRFLIVWEGQGTGDTDGIFGRWYAANGTATGLEVLINTTTSGVQSEPSVAMAPDGRSVVVWSDSSGVWAQLFDASGGFSGPGEIHVESVGSAGSSDVEMAADGSFVVAYRKTLFDPGIYFRRYDDNGTLLSPFAQIVNSTTLGNQTNPSIAMDDTGNFVIVWEGNGTGDPDGVFGRSYAANGTALNYAEFLINETITGPQSMSSAAMLNDGSFVVAWSGPGGADSSGVYSRQFANSPPTITAIANQTIPENGTTGVLSFVVGDAESSATTLVVTASSSNPALVSPGGFVLAGFGANRSITVIPSANQFGTATITITVDDSSTTTSSTFLLTVTEVNNAPVITSNGGGTSATMSVAENLTAVTTVRGFDIDLPAQTLTYSISGGADAAKFTIDSTTGVLRFVAAPNFESPADVGANNVYDVIVRVSDGTLTDTQAIAVTVMPVNDNSPVITSNGGGATASVSVAENATSVTTVTAMDADLPAQTLIYSITGGADAAKFTINSSTGALSFVTAPNYEVPSDVGTNNVYHVTVRTSDGTRTDSQAVTVTVYNVNEAPKAFSDSFTIDEDFSLSITTAGVLGNDSDPEVDALNALLVGNVSNGSLSLNSDGAFNYTPNANFYGTDSFTYKANDGSLNSNVVTVTINVVPVNDSPSINIAASDLNYLEGSPALSIDAGLLISDVDTYQLAGATVRISANFTVGQDQLIFTLFGPISGNFNAATGVLTFTGNGTPSEYQSVLRSVAYRNSSTAPNVLPRTVLFEITDGSLAAVDSRIVRITATNQPPTANPATLTLAENSVNGTVVGSATATDPDGIDSRIYSIISGNSSGAFSINAATGQIVVANRLALDFESTPAFNLQIRVTDGGGLSGTGTIRVNLTNVNEDPIITSDGGSASGSVDANEYSTIVTTVTSMDVDAGTANYSLSGGIDQALFVINRTTGVLEFVTPPIFLSPSDANGDNIYEVRVRVLDGNGGSDTQLLQVNVRNVNETPTSTSIAATTVVEDSAPFVINVASSFTDPDRDSLSFTMTQVSSAVPLFDFITINSSTGVVSADLRSDATGSAVVSIRATDPDGLFVTGQLTINIQGTNDAPFVREYSGSTFTGQTLTATLPGVLQGATDSDGDLIHAVLIQGPQHGTLTLDLDGHFVYRPDDDYFGFDSFVFAGSDGLLTGANATASINIQPPFVALSNLGTSNYGSPSTSSSPGTGSVGTSSSGHSTVSGNLTGTPSSQTAGQQTQATDNAGTATANTPFIAVGLTQRVAATASHDDDFLAGYISTNTLVVRETAASKDSAGSQDSSANERDSSRRTSTADSLGRNRDLFHSDWDARRELTPFELQRQQIYRELQIRSEEHISDFEEKLTNNVPMHGRVVGSVGVVTTGFSVGYLIWAVRGGMLLSGVLSQIPAWTMLDPLMVIDGDGKDDDKESLQMIMDRAQEKLRANSLPAVPLPAVPPTEAVMADS